MYKKALIYILSVTVITMLFNCNIFEPEDKSGGLLLRPVFPPFTGEGLQKGNTNIDRTHVTVTNSAGKTVINKDLPITVISLEGSLRVEAGTYSVQIDCYLNGARVYTCNRAGISVQAGEKTIAALTLIRTTVATPTFSPAPGVYQTQQTVTINCTTPGTDIYYTTNGADPTIASTKYIHPITINSTTILKARVYKTDWMASSVQSGVYEINCRVATPIFAPLSGIYTSPQNVTISCATAGVDIYYTTNGANPTQSSIKYTNTPIMISSATTLKARAFKKGWMSSSVQSGLYEITGTVATPTFAPLPGTYTSPQNVTISCTTPGADIYYTTNGYDPTTASIIYTGAVYINNTMTLKARAYRSGWTDSNVQSGLYEIIGTVATPTFAPLPGTYTSPQNVTISCTTPGADIYYTTNGVDPTTASILYAGAVYINNTMTLKARAYRSGWTDSNVQGGLYEITGTVATPTIAPLPGTYTSPQNVTISCTTPGADIYYTINGVDPTETSTLYVGAISISSTTTLKARAYKTGWTASSVQGGLYEITGTVATPTFAPLPGTYTSPQNVTISCETPGVEIFYTTNGVNPTISSPQYTGVVTISSTTTLKARAYKSGWAESSVQSGVYEITGTVATPVFSPLPGAFANPQYVTINCATLGANIYYTTNGVDPTTSSTPYTGAIYISSTKVLKARAYKSGWNASSVQSGSYRINSEPTGTVTDIDGNVYQTIKIGNQWWMAQDLRVTHYRNGDPIPNVTGNYTWTTLSTGAYCYYNNNSDYADYYGALYNWYAVKDSRNIAPAGWHVSTDAEWQTLVDYLGGWTIAGGELKDTGETYWNSPNQGANNSTGFTARGGGFRINTNGLFYEMGQDCHIWSTKENNEESAWYRCLGYSTPEVHRNYSDKRRGFTVRCVKD